MGYVAGRDIHVMSSASVSCANEGRNREARESATACDLRSNRAATSDLFACESRESSSSSRIQSQTNPRSLASVANDSRIRVPCGLRRSMRNSANHGDTDSKSYSNSHCRKISIMSGRARSESELIMSSASHHSSDASASSSKGELSVDRSSDVDTNRSVPGGSLPPASRIG